MALLLLPASALGQMTSGIYLAGNPGTACEDFADAVPIETAQMCLKAINSFSQFTQATTVTSSTTGPFGCSYFMGTATLNMGTATSSVRNSICATQRCAPDDESIHFLPRDECGFPGGGPSAKYIYTTQAAAEAACIADGCTGLASAVAWEERYDLPLTAMVVNGVVQTESEPCLIARGGSSSGWNCFAAWFADRNAGTGSYFMRPDQSRSGNCGSAGWNDWPDFVGGGADGGQT